MTSRKTAPNPTQAEVEEADNMINRHFGKAKAQAAMEKEALSRPGADGDRIRRLAIIIGTRPEYRSPWLVFADWVAGLVRRLGRLFKRR